MTKAIVLKFACLLLLSGLSLSVCGQKYLRLYERGIAALEGHLYTQAYTLLDEASHLNPDFREAVYKREIARLLSPAGDDDPASDFLKFEGEFSSLDDQYYYWLGHILLRRYQVEDALKAFEHFDHKVSYSGRKEEVHVLLEHSRQLVDFFRDPDDFEIHQLDAPINSAAAEMTPVYFEEGKELLFASDRDSLDQFTPYEIYHSTAGPTGWTDPVKVPNLGAFTRSNANIEVVAGDGKLFLYREENGGDLFFSHEVDRKWTVPVEFSSKISNNNLHAHFFINEHEDRIIFTSETKSSGLDLFETFKDPAGGKWTKPLPFHGAVNSEANEDSPYLSPDESTLYFSSDRSSGVGLYDVYKSDYQQGDYSWSKPENLGWPINSPSDELHFKMNSDQKSGYFISNRLHTKGDFDIYFFWHVDKVTIEGRIYDNSLKGALTNAEIRFHPSQYLDEVFLAKTDHTGRYRTSIISDEVFQVEVILDGQVIHREPFEVHDTSGEPTTYIKDFTVR